MFAEFDGSFQTDSSVRQCFADAECSFDFPAPLCDQILADLARVFVFVFFWGTFVIISKVMLWNIQCFSW